MMDRRAMLRLIAAGLAAGVVDPERLFWVPRQMVTVPAMPVMSIGPIRFLSPEMMAQIAAANVGLFNPRAQLPSFRFRESEVEIVLADQFSVEWGFDPEPRIGTMGG